MKMSECFSLPVRCVFDEDGVPFQIDDSYGDMLIDGERTCDETNFGAVAQAINNHDRQAERIKELEEFVQMVAAGDSAEDSMKGILGHTYIYNAKTLLGQYPHEQ